MTELTREDRRMLTDGIAAILGKTGVRGQSVGGYPAPDAAGHPPRWHRFSAPTGRHGVDGARWAANTDRDGAIDAPNGSDTRCAV